MRGELVLVGKVTQVLKDEGLVVHLPLTDRDFSVNDLGDCV